MMQNPINTIQNQVQQIKNDMMVNIQMPTHVSLESQVENTNQLINQHSSQQRLDMINNYEIQTEEVALCSGSDFLHLFPTKQQLKFKQSSKNTFQIIHQKPSLCGNEVNGSFVNIKDINKIPNVQIKNQNQKGEQIYNIDNNIEIMYKLKHNRKCCWLKWTTFLNFWNYWCCNPCNKPESVITKSDGQIVYLIKYSGLSMDVNIYGPTNNLLYTIKKQCFNGSWILKYANGVIVENFRSKKYMPDSYLNIQEQSKYLYDIQFPIGFKAEDKIAILYAFSLVY